MINIIVLIGFKCQIELFKYNFQNNEFQFTQSFLWYLLTIWFIVQLSFSIDGPVFSPAHELFLRLWRPTTKYAQFAH
jgi:hypothetical protein